MENIASLSTIMSPEIKDLFSALCKAQGAMKPVVFNKVNPYFKNKYADFTSCMESCREPLTSNGLAIMQYCETVGTQLMLVTMLVHVSGQWLKGFFPLIPVKMDSQSIGSAMTYAKRYSLSAMLGLVSEDDDDDAEAAQGRAQSAAKNQQMKPSVVAPKQVVVAPSIPKISPSQAIVLNDIYQKLDQVCRSKIYNWLINQYGFKAMEEVSVDIYEKVLGALENALKYMENNKLQVANV